MANLKYYDTATSEWKTLIVGAQGPIGPTGADSTVPGPGVASGGTAGQILTKVNATDYNTTWSNIPESVAVISSATAPENTTAVWYNTENGNAYVYYDSFWTSISGPPGVPVGGDTGQVLAKSSSTNYATEWVAPSGLTLLVNQNVTASTGYAVDNVFTSQFANYKIVIKVDAMSAGNVIAMNMQYRRAGVTQTATNYYAGTFYMSIDGGTTGVFTRSNGAGNIYLGAAGVPSTPSLFNLDIFSPNVSTTFTQHTLQAMTHYNGTSIANSSNVPLWGGGTHNINTDLDGIILTPGSGSWTGNIKIYGYRN